MNSILQKNYPVFIQAGLITIGLVVLLLHAQVTYFIVNPARVPAFIHILVNTIAFVSLWLLIAYIIHKFSFWKVLGVLSLLVPAMLADQLMNIRQNPITFPLIIVFWIGVAYLILPEFFQKYKAAIFLVYGSVITYYLFVFGTSVNAEDVQRENFANLMLYPIPVFGLLWAYEQWRWLTVLKADKAKAELLLLKSQINPHFFFNTLNNLYGLVVEKSDQAADVILKLSDMMRYTIYEGKEDLVSLKDEVAYLENYIELHKIRYQKKVDIQFSKQLQEDYQIAPLLFIILLENAFKHGVERLTEGAYINLDLTAQANQINFRIENNFEETSSKKSIGIGLENLTKRLEHIYPHRHQLTIDKQASKYSAQLMIDLS